MKETTRIFSEANGDLSHFIYSPNFIDEKKCNKIKKKMDCIVWSSAK